MQSEITIGGLAAKIKVLLIDTVTAAGTSRAPAAVPDAPRNGRLHCAAERHFNRKPRAGSRRALNIGRAAKHSRPFRDAG
jgi:hypothetical protein